MSNIIVIAEVRGGSLKRTSLEAVTAGLQLKSSSGGQVIAIACGNGIDTAAAELANSGADKVITIDGEQLISGSHNIYFGCIIPGLGQIGFDFTDDVANG